MGFSTSFLRLFNSSKLWTGPEGTAEKGELKEGIAGFYDEVAEAWEALWGEHIHHGFYDVGATSLSAADHLRAQSRIIDEALTFAAISDEETKKPKKVLDIGCGIGGTVRYLAKKYGAEIHGITLSPAQAKRAGEIAIAAGLADKVSFQVADALKQPFSDGQFDLLWSMESSEYMPDKEKYLSELVRVAAPGGRIIITTWCHRDLLDSEEKLKPDEIHLMHRICNGYYLPTLCSAAEYIKIFKSLSLEDIRMADWSDNVAPFWTAAISTALTWHGATSLLLSGWRTVKAALAMPLMVEGYEKKLVKYTIITCRKPE